MDKSGRKRATSNNALRQLDPLAYTVADFVTVSGISRSSTYELIKQGKLKSIVVAGRRLVPRSEALRLLSAAA